MNIKSSFKQGAKKALLFGSNKRKTELSLKDGFCTMSKEEKVAEKRRMKQYQKLFKNKKNVWGAM